MRLPKCYAVIHYGDKKRWVCWTDRQNWTLQDQFELGCLMTKEKADSILKAPRIDPRYKLVVVTLSGEIKK